MSECSHWFDLDFAHVAHARLLGFKKAVHYRGLPQRVQAADGSTELGLPWYSLVFHDGPCREFAVHAATLTDAYERLFEQYGNATVLEDFGKAPRP